MARSKGMSDIKGGEGEGIELGRGIIAESRWHGFQNRVV